jgi:hypothetical protein
MTTVRAHPDRSSSRLRVFREEELYDGDTEAGTDDAFGEAPTSELVPPPPRLRPARVTEPLPLPRPPRR